MDITTHPLEDCQVRLTAILDEEQTRQAMEQAARQISKQVNIPGFRKGKAPYDVIVRNYGEDTVRREAAELVIDRIYHQAVEEAQVEPFGTSPQAEVSLEPTLSFEFTISLPPQIDLKDYRDYRLKPPKVRITRKEVRAALTEIQEENVILEPVDRTVAMGDGAVLDAVGRTEEGRIITQAEDVRLLLDAESAEPVPGFAEAIVGMQAGEERTFSLTLPEDTPDPELQGQVVEFDVTVNEVYDATLPDLDDDLARTVGNFDSLKELEADVKERLIRAAQEEADDAYAVEVVNDIVDAAEVAYPPELLEETLDDMLDEAEQRVRQQTQLSLEDYLRVQGQSLDDLREQLRPQAQDQLKRALVLGQVVSQEHLDVEQQEIDEHIEILSAPFGVRADEVRQSMSSPQAQAGVRRRLLADKAIERLMAIARGEGPEIDSEEASPEANQEEEA